MKKSIYGMCCALLWIAVIGYSLGVGATAIAAPSQGTGSASSVSIFGEWKEYWGTPGQTDVTYHDEYRITRTADGKVLVKPLSGDEPISEIQFNQGLLSFNQRTYAFVVRYSLKLQPDGQWLIGTATTPVKTYPIKWERTQEEVEVAPPPAPASVPASAASIFGEWKEYWGIPGQTDVTYHDEYRISRGVDGKVKIQILSRNQAVENERLEQNQLTFVHHTDSYAVKYALTLQPDGQWLVGTATTPVKSYPIKWEKIKSESDVVPAPMAPSSSIVSVLGEWKEHWGVPGRTDVTYNDEYRVTRSSDGTIKVETLNRNQLIDDVRLDQRLLTFTQHSDAFLVKYSLTLHSDGQWMIGTATTPVKAVPVIWERIKDAADTGPLASIPAVSPASWIGDWSEHWGTPGQTDVTYHDQYRISSAGGSQVKVKILNRNQAIEDEQVVENRLTFTQHTDSYLVRYALTLQPDSRWLVGTATTPLKVETVKWERMR